MHQKKRIRLTGWLWALGGAIAVWLFNLLLPHQVLPVVDPLDARIRDLRMGELVIRVVDDRQQPISGAKIHLTQTAHAFEFGTALSTEMFSDSADPAVKDRYLALASQLFNAGVHENALKWYSTEPNQGQVSYGDADRILDWAEQHQFKMRGHTLFWAVDRWNQPWLKALSGDALRHAVQQRATEICSRYRGRIAEYDVLNEMLNGDFFQQRLGDGIVDDMFRWCRTADPDAVLYTNEYDILNGNQLDAYVRLIQALQRRGVPLGGIGVQAHIQQDMTREQMQHSLDTLATLGLPITITEFSARSETEQKQAQVLTDLYRVAFAHPAVHGILMWGFWEGAHWIPEAAIFRRNFDPKPAAQAYKDLLYRQWWTQADDTTSMRGEATTRAFFGNYTLTVEAGGHSFTQRFSLTSGRSTPQVITVVAPAPVNSPLRWLCKMVLRN